MGFATGNWRGRRLAALIIGGLGAALWLVVANSSFGSIDPATNALDAGLGWVVTILFAVTAAPALTLAATGRAARAALALAIAFPAAFALLFLVLIAWWEM